jgi:DNA modification methylase
MLESNRIYCADCLSIIEEIDDNSIDLIILDPPYLTTKQKWDKEEVVSEKLAKQLFRVLKDSGSLYVWCGIGEKSQSLIRWFPIFSKDFKFKDLITWKKQRGIGMRKGWLYTREEIMWFVKNNKKFVWNKEHQYSDEKRVFTASYSDKERMKKYLQSVKSPFKRLTNVWTDIRETNITWNKKESKVFHFTPKPLKALKRIIKSHTNKGDLVLDCFAGSGSIAFACKELERDFILIEQNLNYCNAISQKGDIAIGGILDY